MRVRRFAVEPLGDVTVYGGDREGPPELIFDCWIGEQGYMKKRRMLALARAILKACGEKE